MQKIEEDSIPAQEHQPGLSPYESRQDQWQRPQGFYYIFTGNMKPWQQNRKGNTDSNREDGGYGADEYAVFQTSQVIGIMEKRFVTVERKLSRFRADEACLENEE